MYPYLYELQCFLAVICVLLLGSIPLRDRFHLPARSLLLIGSTPSRDRFNLPASSLWRVRNSYTKEGFIGPSSGCNSTTRRGCTPTGRNGSIRASTNIGTTAASRADSLTKRRRNTSRERGEAFNPHGVGKIIAGDATARLFLA